MRAAAFLLLLVRLLLAGGRLTAAEVLPPAPTRHFNDYAGVVTPAVAERIDRQLAEFERTRSTQVVVAVFRRMESGSSIEDHVHRMFEAWRIGQRGKDNGVLLAVFQQERRLRIEVGYGLEGALPDVLARRIIDQEIVPHLRQGRFDAGLQAGVDAILAATRGEYRGETRRPGGSGRLVFNRYFPWNVVLALLLVSFLWRRIAGPRRGRGWVYDGAGRRAYRDGGGWGGWSGGGGWGGGFSGGGFSGGGGRSGGGGASGSW